MLAEGGFTDNELVLLNLQKGEQKVVRPFLLQDGAAYRARRVNDRLG